MSKAPKSLDKIIDSKRNFLIEEAKTFSNLSSKHNGEKGRLNEEHLMRCLREFLPSKMGLGTGFIQDVAGNHSCQQDIIIFDAHNNVPLYNADSWAIYPIEMIYGVIEVKTTLTKDELIKCFRNQGQKAKNGSPNPKSFQWMAERTEKHYADYVPVEKKDRSESDTDTTPNVAFQPVFLNSPTPPRFFIFAYKNGYKPTKKQTAFDKLTSDLKELAVTYDVHFHGICILEENWFLARSQKPREECELLNRQDNGFKIFLNNLLVSCDSIPMFRANRFLYCDPLIQTLNPI